MITIAPSILSCDHCDLLRGVHIAEDNGITHLHVDIMDGNFVPNISFGAQLVRDLHRHTPLKLDVHLMLQYPEKFVDRFIEYGANSISIHQESNGNIGKILADIRGKNCISSLAINPGTVPAKDLLHHIDYLLVMGVHPGFCGQKFIPGTIDTIKRAVEYRDKNKLDFQIAIDGGVTIELVPQLIKAGAEVIISGNAFFQSPQKFMQSLQRYLK